MDDSGSDETGEEADHAFARENEENAGLVNAFDCQNATSIDDQSQAKNYQLKLN